MRFNEVKSQEAGVRTIFVHFEWDIPDVPDTVKLKVFHLSVCNFAIGLLGVSYIKMYFVILQAEATGFLSIY